MCFKELLILLYIDVKASPAHWVRSSCPPVTRLFPRNLHLSFTNNRLCFTSIYDSWHDHLFVILLSFPGIATKRITVKINGVGLNRGRKCSVLLSLLSFCLLQFFVNMWMARRLQNYCNTDLSRTKLFQQRLIKKIWRDSFLFDQLHVFDVLHLYPKVFHVWRRHAMFILCRICYSR